MWDLTIRIKKNDEVGGNGFRRLLLISLGKLGLKAPQFGQMLTALVNVENPLCILKAFP
jgi:hypothetical protein